MKATAKKVMAWRKARGEGGMMPLLFALCALLSVAPSQAASLRPDALRDFSPAHFAALALLAAPAANEATPQSPAAAGRAALLLALCRESVGSAARCDAAPFEVSARAADTTPLLSRATLHCAQRTQPRPPHTSHAPRILAALLPQLLFAHEAAQLSGVRTNRTLL